MNHWVKIIGVFAVVVSVFSCSEEEKEIHRPFADVVNFDDEVKTIHGGLIKTVITGEKVETQNQSSPDWENIELQPFIEADFNRPANKDNYQRLEHKSELAGWTDVTYIGTKKKLPVIWATYRYQDSVCIGAVLEVQKLSKGYDLIERLTYIPSTGYSIDNTQTLRSISEEQFYLSGEFENKPQPWRMYFDIGKEIIPVNFDLDLSNSTITFHQGKEKIEVEMSISGTTFRVEMPIFQSYLEFEISENTINGEFHNLDKGANYMIPFTAEKLPYELAFGTSPSHLYPKISGKWETYFEEGDEKTPAIGIFERLGDDLIGTFATETGDYRFLQGKIVGDSFSLSTFDGSHLFLFTGKIKGDEITNGQFYSGSHYHTTWSAKRNDAFKLTNPDEMTSLTEDDFDFTFPDLSGIPISLSDDQFKNKVVIIQILGSWCPNCMDETRYFVDLYRKYNNSGLEIIGLAFERSNDFENAKTSLNKAINDLNVPYTMLIAGTPKEASSVLPIEKVKSYPTSIFMDKSGKVVKVHTGFYGPGTGEYYEEYVKETEVLIEELLGK